MEKTISSPLLAAANSISLLGNTSDRNFAEVKRDYKGLLDFMEIGTSQVEGIKLPKEKKIRELANINIASNFGSAGNLLTNLASGALDVAGFVSNFFPGNGDVGKPKPPAGKPRTPSTIGSKLRFSGFRSIGITNAIFAGLDFATGLQEGESVGQSAAGAGGSLAGSLLGGAIGQTLIPIPGVGFVLGSMAGGFLGGYAADRAYEATAGKSDIQKKQDEKLKAQEEKQRSAEEQSRVPVILKRFSDSVDTLQKFANKTLRSIFGAAGADDIPQEYGPPMPEMTGTKEKGEYQDVVATGGRLPSKSTITSRFGLRWGTEHKGTDYSEPTGTPISVIQPGKVKYAGWDDRAGYFVEINHSDGSMTRYLHLNKPANVKTGQSIEPGTVIGNVGSTGRSTGSHLHFEYAPPGKRQIDSESYADKYFRFGGNVKVVPKKPAGQSSASTPTAVITAGTNDTDPKKSSANIQKSIEELKKKGYNVVVVPPSQQEGSPYASIGLAVEQVSKQAGAKIEKATYKGEGDAAPFTQLDSKSVESLQNKYKGALFIGDGNAENFQGSMSYRGRGSSYILQQIQSLQKVRAIGGEEFDPNSLTPEQIQEYQNYVLGVPSKTMVDSMESYPAYNSPGQSSMTFVPIMMGSNGSSSPQRPVIITGGDSGGGTIILPGPTEGQIVNSLMRTMLLTNLSGS